MNDEEDSRPLFAVKIGERVRALRAESGVPLAELARRSGVAKGTLANLEAGRGNPTVQTLGALAEALGLPLGDLIVEADGPSIDVQRTTEHRGPRLLHRLPSGPFTEMWHMRLRAGECIERRGHAAGTVEHILVLVGALTVRSLDATARLAPGDFCRLRADGPHAYAAEDGPAEAAVWMAYPAILPPFSPPDDE